MTILGWRRPGKITQRLHLKQQRKLLLFLFSAEILRGIRVASAIRPVWAAAFSAGLLMDLNRAGDSLYQGGEFFAEIQRGVRRTTAVGKRVDTYGFYPLNSRFLLRLSLVQTRDRRPP